MRCPLLAALLLSVACGEDPDASLVPALDGGQPSPEDAGSVPDDAGTDAGGTDGGGTDAGDTGGADGGGLPGEPRTWTWVPEPDNRCMDGSPTGFGFNPNPGATGLVLFLQGGNACFNQGSCLITANTDGYGPDDFAREMARIGNQSAFDRAAAENPFRDHHFAYVPYCTGDVHAGDNPNGEVAGRSWQFVGHSNLRRIVDRLVPALPELESVVLVGVSAGGFGAALNFDFVQRRFGDTPVTLVDDSGPPMATEFLAPCLQAHFRRVWGLDAGALAACPSCDGDPGGAFVEDFLAYTFFSHPDRRFAFLSFEADQVIQSFWGYGNDDCAGIDALFPPAYPAERFGRGLVDLRDRILDGIDGARVWFAPGTGHVLLSAAPWSRERDGTVLSDWLRAAAEQAPGWQNVPAP